MVKIIHIYGSNEYVEQLCATYFMRIISCD